MVNGLGSVLTSPRSLTSPCRGFLSCDRCEQISRLRKLLRRGRALSRRSIGTPRRMRPISRAERAARRLYRSLYSTLAPKSSIRVGLRTISFAIRRGDFDGGSFQCAEYCGELYGFGQVIALFKSSHRRLRDVRLRCEAIGGPAEREPRQTALGRGKKVLPHAIGMIFHAGSALGNGVRQEGRTQVSHA